MVVLVTRCWGNMDPGAPDRGYQDGLGCPGELESSQGGDSITCPVPLCSLLPATIYHSSPIFTWIEWLEFCSIPCNAILSIYDIDRFSSCFVIWFKLIKDLNWWAHFIFLKLFSRYSLIFNYFPFPFHFTLCPFCPWSHYHCPVMWYFSSLSLWSNKEGEKNRKTKIGK